MTIRMLAADDFLQPGSEGVERLGLIGRPAISNVGSSHSTLDDVVQALIDDVSADA